MTQRCEQIGPLLLDLVDGKLRVSLRAEVEEHLTQCDVCREKRDSLCTTLASMPIATSLLPSTRVREEARALGLRPAPSRGAPVDRPSRPWMLAVGLAVAMAAIGFGVRGLTVTTAPQSVATGSLGGQDIEPGEPPSPGSAFPAYSGVDIASGETVSIEALRGRVVVINVWATWCRPCEDEMPSLERLYRELGPEGLAVVAVSVDQESTFKVRNWINDRDLTFTVLHDRDGLIERRLRTTGVPESWVIDRDGVLVLHEVGPRLWDTTEAAGVVRRLVAEGQ